MVASVGFQARSGAVSVQLVALRTDRERCRHASGDVRDDGVRPASLGGDRGYASDVLAAHHLSAPVDRVSADVPAGARVAVDVRGRTADGTWTEWRQAAPACPPADRGTPASDPSGRRLPNRGAGPARVAGSFLVVGVTG